MTITNVTPLFVRKKQLCGENETNYHQLLTQKIQKHHYCFIFENLAIIPSKFYPLR
jgi:hypothetical protein